MGVKVESVTKTAYLGLYEVFADGHIFYTDEKVTAMLIGGDLIRSQHAVNLIDLKANANVTDARMRKLQAIQFSEPLLEGVNLSGARGVLVNITAAKGNLKMKEVNEVMNTVKAFAAEDAHIIFGAVYDELMGDSLRVTVVATGLGRSD